MKYTSTNYGYGQETVLESALLPEKQSHKSDPTEQELFQAQMLLEQQEIIANQKDHETLLALIFLGQQN